MLPQEWRKLHQRFQNIRILDGTTLEDICKRLENQKSIEGALLAGRYMMSIGFWTRIPTHWVWTEDDKANDKSFYPEIKNFLEKGQLLVFDMGFFSFTWMDYLTEDNIYFITRIREKTNYRILSTILSTDRLRISIIQPGLYRSNPCKHRLRLVEHYHKGKWHSYISNILDNNLLSP